MGVSTVTAARIFEGQQRGEPGEENFLFDETFPYSAFSKTYNTNQQTSDSAGTMTAKITGVKAKAGVISVNDSVSRGDADSIPGNEVFTLLEKAEIAGKSTYVSINRILNVTPVACYSHVPERNWESDGQFPEGSVVKDIAAQLIDFPADWEGRDFPSDGLRDGAQCGRSV